MGFKAVDYVQITTGLADNAGAWNANTDISQYLYIPGEATAVALAVVNHSTSSGGWGIRHGNSANNISNTTNLIGGGGEYRIVSLLTKDAYNVQIRRDRTSINVYVVGFYSDLFVYHSDDYIANTYAGVNTWQTRKITSPATNLPTGTKAVLVRYNHNGNTWWRKTGTTSPLYPATDSVSFWEVDSSGNVDSYISSSASQIYWGYARGHTVDKENFIDFTQTIVDVTTLNANSGWNTFPNTFPGKSCVHIYAQGISNTFHTRAKGSTFGSSGLGYNGLGSATRIVGLDANGAFEYALRTGTVSGNVYVVATINSNSSVSNSLVYNIATTNAITTSDGTITLNGRGLDNVDSIRIYTSGSGQTKYYSNSTSSNTYFTASFSAPTDSNVFASNICPGNVIVSTLKSGTRTANLNTTLTLTPEWTKHDVTNVSQNTNSNTIYYNQSLPVSANDAIVHSTQTQNNRWGVTVDNTGFIRVGTFGSKLSDSLQYKIFYNQYEEWSNTGTLTIQTPYINVDPLMKRIMASGDGKRYSRYPEGGGPRYTPTIIVRNQNELNVALSNTSTNLSGQIIGVEYNAQQYFVDETIFNNKYPTQTLTICGYGSRMPQFSYIRAREIGNTKWSGLDVYKQANGSCVVINSGTDNIRFEYNKIHSTYCNPNGTYGAYEPDLLGQATGVKFISSGAGANIANVYFYDNKMYDLLEGLVTSKGYCGDFHFIGNEVSNVYTGAMTFSPEQTNGTTKINWNIMHDAYGLSSDADIGLGTPPHVDFIQPRAVQKNFDIEIIGNILFTGTSRCNTTQGIFLDDNHVVGDETHFYTANVKGNLIVTNSLHAISVLQSKNSNIIGNSVLPANSNATIGARVNIGTGTTSFPNGNGGGNKVKNTVAHTINGASTETNNYEYNSYSAATLANFFTGPTFSGSAWATKESVLAACSMLVGNPFTDVAVNIGSVGTGYVDYVNRTLNTSMEA